MRVCMAMNLDIVYINYQDYKKDIKKFIISETGKKSKELVYEKENGTKFEECFA